NGAQRPGWQEPSPNGQAPAAGTQRTAGAEGPAAGGQAISVRTLGQGVAFAKPEQGSQQVPAPQQRPAPTGGSGRRRKLSAPPEPARQHPGDTGSNPAFQPSDSEGKGQAFA